MNTTKIITMVLALLLTVVMMVGCSASSGKSTASAWLSEGDYVADVTVDLSGGWSVEFAYGAAYLYSKEIKDGIECDAMLVVLDKEVYDEYVAEANTAEGRREVNGAIVYKNPYEDGDNYLFSPAEGFYYILVVDHGINGDDVYARITVTPEYYDT